MKAIVCESYGGPEVLQLREVPRPVPRSNEILIRVRATAVSSGDIRLRKPDPFAVRFMFGMLKPKYAILGVALAGVVEAKGQDVGLFNVGDEVFGSAGMTCGAYAEYVCLPEAATLALKPSGMSFEEAAAIPFGGTTALSFLKKGDIQNGGRVLVYGASGAVGTSAVQLAKHFGAHVTGVCSTANLEMVRSLGADDVIDYTKDDLSIPEDTFDIILDTVGKSPFSVCVRALKENGRYLRVVHMEPADIIRGIWVSLTTNKKVIGGVIKESAEDMAFLKGLIEIGSLTPVIDRTYTLEQIPEAHAYVEKGHKKGNVIIAV
ncbi:MAG: NAD(P)-dependent alcohol dehydrogenase [Pyrinomonadaceae bacterium]|nr:NAD(P)-dependent alcohol dehydrogenase [Acidobacteriota bacterium]MBP7416157.1 NAD(P)-dependent alcohol dehydrogenase [Pyrinomonadaceae bacterium]